MGLEKLGRLLVRGAPILNVPVAALANSERFGGLVKDSIAMVTYTGRRSGRSFSIPVSYRRSGDDVVIGVGMPDAKSWWRNFLGDGGPITLLNFRGTDRTGHAVATRDDAGRVTVRVRLD